MNKLKAWTIIISTGLVASVTTSAACFPDYKVILVAVAGLITAVATFISSQQA